jgi:hypothetical protein
MSPRAKKTEDQAQVKKRKYPRTKLAERHGYDEEYESCPPEILQAENQYCGGNLRVQVYAYSCYDSEHQEDQEYTPIANHEVSVAEVSYHGGDKPFYDCRRTGSNGEVLFTGLRAGEYRITVLAPQGYQPVQTGGKLALSAAAGSHGGNASDASQSVGLTRYYADGTVTIVEGGEEIVPFYSAPQPATITGFVYFDPECCGDPEGKEYIGGAPVDFYRGNDLIACVTTQENGYFNLEISCPGTINIVPRPAIKVGDRTFRSAVRGRIIIQLQPGQNCSVALGYCPNLGEIQVAACLLREDECEEEEDIRLSNVTFTLFRGTNCTGDPIGRLTTRGQTLGSFIDLDEGDYTIVPHGPAYYNGEPVEIDCATGGVAHVNLCAGQTIKLTEEFCFKPRRGTAIGMVVDEACGKGVGGVTMLLTREDGEDQPIPATSASTGETIGETIFPNIRLGTYIASLEQDKVTLPDGSKWTISPRSAAEYRIVVGSPGPTRIPEFRLVEEVHKIFGRVATPDGISIPYAVIDIEDDAGNRIDSVTADSKANYEYIAQRAGTYFLSLRLSSGGQPAQRFRAAVNQPVNANITGPPGPGGGLGGIVRNLPNTVADALESVIGLGSFPVLTEEINSQSISRSNPLSMPGQAPLGQIVEGALKEVLGWRPKMGDTKGFIGALNQSFELTEVQGHTEFKWTPRTYAVQTDLAGGITGAQASIYSRAKDAIDKALPLLDGLSELRLDADQQDMEALKAIVRSQMEHLVNELGQSGGPRTARVEQLFFLLLGQEVQPPPDPDDVGGQLGTLRREFGLRSVPNPITGEQGNLVNTVEEEQTLTNFRILADYLTSLRQSWIVNRRFFARPTPAGTQPFFGTQLVLLSRTLSVVAESVEEVRFTMDSVFIGGAERQTLEIVFPPGTGIPSIFVEELLSWVSSFAAEEGPRLIQDGGKFAVNQSFLPMAILLRDMVRGAVTPVNVLALPAGYRSPRVRRSLEELATHLGELVTLANPIQHNIPSQ